VHTRAHTSPTFIWNYDLKFVFSHLSCHFFFPRVIKYAHFAMLPVSLVISNLGPIYCRIIQCEHFTLCHWRKLVLSPPLTLLWYHEKSYVNSTMGSIWHHCKKKTEYKHSLLQCSFPPQNNISQHRFVLKYRQMGTTLS